MKWIKAAIVGALAALIMFLCMQALVVVGIAPFNTPPSAAFLISVDMPPEPLAAIGHFLYGMLWSMVLVGIYGPRTSIGKGLTLSLLLWLVMMVVYTPVIGWGLFGFGGEGQALPADHPLHLSDPITYVIATLVIHLIYGAIIGGLNPAWGRRPESSETDEPGAARQVP